jgi:hypothetical protein
MASGQSVVFAVPDNGEGQVDATWPFEFDAGRTTN